MTNPVELLHGVSGLSPGQAAAIYKAPFIEHLRVLPRIGAKTPRQIFNCGGLYYGANTACGDFTGTAMGGSGGPAGLAYGPTGQYTIVGAGKVIATGADSTHFNTQFPLSDVDPSTPDDVLPNTLRYKCAIRRMTRARYAFTGATWDPATRKLDFTSGVAPAGWSGRGPTGDDWVCITVAGTDGVTGWYRLSTVETIRNAIAGGVTVEDECILTDDLLNATAVAAGIDGFVLKSDQSGMVKPAVWDSNLGYLAAPAPYTASPSASRIFQDQYIAGPNDTVEILDGNGFTRCFCKVLGQVANYPRPDSTRPYDTIEIDSGGEDVAYSFRTTATYNSGTGELTAVSGNPWANYTYHDGDYMLVYSSSLDAGASIDYVRIQSKTSDSVLVVNTLDMTGLGVSNGSVIDCDVAHIFFRVLRRTDFVHVDLDPTNPWTNVTDPSGLASSTVLLSSSPGWTPQQGDFYYIYVDGDDSGGSEWPNGTRQVVVETDPEGMPTRSAASSLFCSWPFFSAVPCRPYFQKSNGGVANCIAAPIGSGINHAWHGMFQLAPETWMAGDWVTMQLVADAGYMGTPYFIEVLVIMDFDPEDDTFWRKDASIDVSGQNLQYRCVWFHSPVITRAGINPINIRLFGKSSSDQTIGTYMTSDTISMQWTCGFDIGGQGGDGSQLPPDGFPAQIGPISKVLQPRLYNKNTAAWEGFQRWWLEHARVSVLLKCEHPSMRGRPGYHAYYPGEPYDADTGNGNVLLGGWGSLSGITPEAAVLPWAPRVRIGSVDVVWGPGGNF